MDRNYQSFWAVWREGLEWPMLFAHENMAKQKAHQLAKENVGSRVHLMRLSSVGTAEYPAKPIVSGDLKEVA